MYAAFAQYYDRLTANVSYEKRADYFCEIFSRHRYGGSQGGGGNLLLDLACGTGSLSYALAARGWEVIGVDGSVEMLSAAMQKQADFQGGKPPLFLRQDMQQLDLFGTVDVCVCALDSLNHITRLGELEAVFRRLALFVESGGLFVFDVNTPFKHSSVLANQTFVYDEESVYCVWQNTPRSGGVVDIDLDFFRLEKNGLYSRHSECFSERAYSDEELRACAVKAGFETIAVYSADTFSEPKPEDERLVYVMENMTEHRSYDPPHPPQGDKGEAAPPPAGALAPEPLL